MNRETERSQDQAKRHYWHRQLTICWSSLDPVMALLRVKGALSASVASVTYLPVSTCWMRYRPEARDMVRWVERGDWPILASVEKTWARRVTFMPLLHRLPTGYRVWLTHHAST